MSENLNQKKDLVKVVSVTPLFPVGFSRTPIPPIPELHEQLSRPIIELKLENDKRLRLMGIPYEIAVEIWMVLKSQGKTRIKRDPRLSISELLCELADVDHIEITDILPDLGVYVADVYIRVRENNGKERRVGYKMIPSHLSLIHI